RRRGLTGDFPGGIVVAHQLLRRFGGNAIHVRHRGRPPGRVEETLMLTLIILEGIVIVLLTVLVAGLLRSHADILRTLDRLGAGDGVSLPATGGIGLGPTRRSTGEVAVDSITGMTLDGQARQVALTGSRG